MANRFANGAKSFGFCDYCGFRFDLKKLKNLTVKTKRTEIKACNACWTPDQPQLQLGMYPVSDPQAIRDPRPDTNTWYQSGVLADGSIGGGSRVIEWGWAPVGGSSSFDAVLTPNALVGIGEVGTATVTSTGTLNSVFFTTPGTTSWTAPAGVTEAVVICVGGGGSSYSVSPDGDGVNGGDSSFDTLLLAEGGGGGIFGGAGGMGGQGTVQTATVFGSDGGSGGDGTPGPAAPGAGGGAGGYFTAVYTGIMPAALINAAVNLDPEKTLFKDTLIGGRPLGDINNTGTVTSADSLAYLRFNTGDAQPASYNDYIINVLNPYMLANAGVYNQYILYVDGGAGGQGGDALTSGENGLSGLGGAGGGGASWIEFDSAYLEYLLQETSDFLLQEDAGKIVIAFTGPIGAGGGGGVGLAGLGLSGQGGVAAQPFAAGKGGSGGADGLVASIAPYYGSDGGLYGGGGGGSANGAGGGGGGGGLRWSKLAVTPGSSYTVVVGAGGQVVNGGSGANGAVAVWYTT